MLHVIITKSLFNAETQKIGTEFEKDIKKEFEKLGYTYSANVTDNRLNPHLEIDGVAVKDQICYVIEGKAWRFPHLVEENTKTEQITRDLKGIVDGTKYSTKEEARIPQLKPSLLQKIAYVKSNIGVFNSGKNSIKDVRGLIVTLNQPPMREYRGIQIISINELHLL